MRIPLTDTASRQLSAIEADCREARRRGWLEAPAPHDVETRLTAIVGNLDSLMQATPPMFASEATCRTCGRSVDR